MQKIFSTRLDEAIRLRAEQVTGRDDADVWSDTLGAWQRRERPETTIRRARRAVQRSFARHRRP